MRSPPYFAEQQRTKLSALALFSYCLAQKAALVVLGSLLLLPSPRPAAAAQTWPYQQVSRQIIYQTRPTYIPFYTKLVEPSSYDSTAAALDLEAGKMAELGTKPEVAALYYQRIIRKKAPPEQLFQANMRLGHLYYAQQDYHKALQYYTQCLELPSGSYMRQVVSIMQQTAKAKLLVIYGQKQTSYGLAFTPHQQDPARKHRVRPRIVKKNRYWLESWRYRDIRVKLKEQLHSVSVGVDLGGIAYPFTYRLEGKLIVTETGQRTTSIKIGVRQGLCRINGKQYRGKIELLVHNGGIMAVNILALEEYLFGVLPKEVYPSWDIEALKAQAVAARTYALYKMQLNKAKFCDLDATVLSQVYGGYAAETPTTNQAVLATSGEIITYNNAPILASYHSNSGGFLENDSLVWAGTDRPYLETGPDKYSVKSNEYRWERKIPASEIAKKLFGETSCADSLQLENLQYSRSGRVVSITTRCGNRKITLSGNNFRLKVGARNLRSTLFQVKKEQNMLIFRGYGYGHGVGLSQTGAQNMAQLGFDYRKILTFYYNGVVITNINQPQQAF